MFRIKKVVDAIISAQPPGD